MFFTHALPSQRDERPHTWNDVILDIDPRTKARIIRAYRDIRRAGISQFEARGLCWDIASAAFFHGRVADHDCWR